MMRNSATKWAFLDLRRSGLSILDRLVLEELLLRHDPQKRCWAIVGTHDPTRDRLVRTSTGDFHHDGEKNVNDRVAIVLGLGGKAERLLDATRVRSHNVRCLRRFSGGGTVVVDRSSLFTTFVGRPEAGVLEVEPYPRSIMDWTAHAIFSPVFQRMNAQRAPNQRAPSPQQRRPSLVMSGPSCGMTDISNSSSSAPPSPQQQQQQQQQQIPKFRLLENDYVLGDHKMGGSAQCITKEGWLHHTSFLWDFDETNMEYLTLPEKRPAYRNSRTHRDFLVKLKTYYGRGSSETNDNGNDQEEGPDIFFNHVRDVVISQTLDDDDDNNNNNSNNNVVVEEVSLSKVLEVADDLGGIQHWFDTKCRTRTITV